MDNIKQQREAVESQGLAGIDEWNTVDLVALNIWI